MTATNKPVQRVSLDSYSVLYSGKKRPIVVRIGQGDILQFREKGRRQWFVLPIDFTFGVAVKIAAGYSIRMFAGQSQKNPRPRS